MDHEQESKVHAADNGPTRIYLNENRQGIVTCVHCGVKRALNMSNYSDHHLGEKSLKVKCSTCQKTFQIRFDFRRYHRINVTLPGKICALDTGEEVSEVTVISLSVGGVGFLLLNDQHQTSLGAHYTISFQLDDDQHATVCEEIVVRRCYDRFVGAEFYPVDQYNYELDFYITADPSNP